MFCISAISRITRRPGRLKKFYHYYQILPFESFTVYFGSLGERLQQGEDLAAAVNAAASEQNYEAE